ncbi:hypothetical protein Zm00014a_006158 [Zea mays]|jgi:hypothetical protein|uniref:Uncharacterized protein n=1 Tax=Zea mays TaxID=4577 RepID=A0A3L6EA66_MAIZE|nr:hypothetical protein Zm00014a_006158 [Zea mays]
MVTALGHRFTSLFLSRRPHVYSLFPLAVCHSRHPPNTGGHTPPPPRLLLRPSTHVPTPSPRAHAFATTHPTPMPSPTPPPHLTRPWSNAAVPLRLAATRAVARAREGRRTTALASGESGRYRLSLAHAGAPARARGEREGGESEARHWRGESAGESGVTRSDWSTYRDMIGPRVLIVATSRF